MISSPFFIPTVIFLIVSIPLVLGVVPKNRWYGIRTVKTLADDQAWYSANRFGGLAFIVSNLIYLGTSACFPYTKSAPDNFSVWGIHLAAFALPLAISVLLTLRHIRKL